MSGQRGSMLITLKVLETMNSWMPFVSITVHECVRLREQLRPEPLTGSQLVKLGRRSMQTPLWVSGASMRSKALNATAPTMQSASSAPKVCIYRFVKSLFFFSLLKLCLCKSETLHLSSVHSSHFLVLHVQRLM